MPLAVSALVRQAILHRHQRGQDSGRIAEALQLNERTVRHLLRRLATVGLEALRPSYDACGQARQPGQAAVHRRTLKLRDQHPCWGAGRMRIELAKNFPDRDVPSERTLQRWLREHGKPPAPAGRPVGTKRPRSTQVHEVWQMDAAEQKRLATGAMISWLRVNDECSGAVLQTVVFSRGTLQLRSTHGGANAFEAAFHQARAA